MDFWKGTMGWKSKVTRLFFPVSFDHFRFNDAFLSDTHRAVSPPLARQPVARSADNCSRLVFVIRFLQCFSTEPSFELISRSMIWPIAIKVGYHNVFFRLNLTDLSLFDIYLYSPQRWNSAAIRMYIKEMTEKWKPSSIINYASDVCCRPPL